MWVRTCLCRTGPSPGTCSACSCIIWGLIRWFCIFSPCLWVFRPYSYIRQRGLVLLKTLHCSNKRLTCLDRLMLAHFKYTSMMTRSLIINYYALSIGGLEQVKGVGLSPAVLLKLPNKLLSRGSEREPWNSNLDNRMSPQYWWLLPRLTIRTFRLRSGFSFAE